jgi:hypothetical protein
MDRGNAGRALSVAALLFFAFILLAQPAHAKTGCKTEDCKITITIKMAFSYNSSEISAGTINGWMNDIEDVWNGPNGYRTTGDCECEVRFKAEWKQITDPSQVNCNPGPPGYHCIMVTDYDKDPPRNQTSLQGAETYRGYMYGVSQGGASTNGWWSDDMNDPYPGTGADTHDAAHEAGHMMGLDDGEGDGIMTHTSGDKAKPTQENIDDAVKNVCPAGACPDRCCCGNGQVDDDKGEQCDPFAVPISCDAGEACCPVCCSCFKPSCDPGQGEYATQDDCQDKCEPQTTSKCYYNYKTGCWDCIGNTVVTQGVKPYDPEMTRDILECSHAPTYPRLDIDLSPLVGVRPLEGIPMADIFANERINVYIDGEPMAGIVMSDGVIEQAGTEVLEDQTMNIHASMETVERIATGETTLGECFLNGDISYEGVGFVNMVKAFIAGIGIWFYSLAAAS